MNILRRFIPEEKISKTVVRHGILIFAVAVAWGAIVLNAPVLKLLTLLGPIFGIIACLIPAYLVYKVDACINTKASPWSSSSSPASCSSSRRSSL